ncbi:MAG: tetratricopeptide repeat protein [Acidobacteria bacterium]|nr:tetratricopeptide repeat protein [Acidobacteriota bacterium]
MAQAGIFLLGLGVVLAPVAIRNAIVGGGFQLTTAQFGPNFYIGNNPRADGTYMSLRFGRGDAEYERQDATVLAERALGRRLSPREVSAYWAGRAVEYIRTQPADWGGLMARKAALLVNATEMLDTESQQTHAEYSLVLTVLGPVAHFGVLAPLAVFGICVTWARRRELSLFYWMLGAYAASVVLFYVFARYRYPLVPFLMLLAAAAVADTVRFLHESRRARVAATVAMVAGFAVFSRWPLLSADLMRAITENNLATALREAGRPDEAEAHYRRALEISPEYAAAHSNLGALLRAGGRVEEAIAHYREALRLQPDHTSARYNLANALLAQGRAAEAAEQFRHALAQDPQSVAVHNNLGIALATAGRPEEAARSFRQALAIDPASAEAHVNLGKVLEDLGAVDEAVGHLRQAVAVRPDYFDAHYDLGRVLLARGELTQAIGHLQRAVALDPQSPDAHNNLGIALASSGQLDEAIAQFERALHLRPDLAEARRNLAAARAAMHR